MIKEIKYIGEYNSLNRDFKVEIKDLKELRDWELSKDLTLNHISKSFFSFIALSNKTNNFLISQNEIGMLAIFSKYRTNNFDEQYFLLQKKFEPGNDPISQLSPAIQMTYSNLKGKHGGRINNLNFIKNLSLKANFSTLQLEQSDSFLHKKNLNYFGLLENNELPDFFKCIDLFWLSSKEIIDFAMEGNILHADTRSVLFFIFFRELIKKKLIEIGNNDLNTLLSKFSLFAFKNQSPWIFKKMKDICVYRNGKIYLDDKKEYFDKRYIIGVSVKSNSREISIWDQPLLSIESKTIYLFVSKKEGEYYLLVSIGLAPGLFTEFEILPSFVENYSEFKNFDYSKLMRKTKELHTSWQTEEGGRFYKRRNLHKIIFSEEMHSFENKPNLFWIKLNELYKFSFNTNFVSMELRSIGFLFFAHLLKK